MFHIQISHKSVNIIIRSIKSFGGDVTAIIESEHESDCFFLGDEQVLRSLQDRFPKLKVVPADSIDWEEQSALHSPFYKDGLIEIPLNNKKILKLFPGPAFGDASHPSTRLALELLQERVLEATVLDIGAGNGILALASALMGASRVVGVEIDPEALIVAHQNCSLNKLENSVQFIPPDTYEDSSFELVVANMTLSDQRGAFPQYFNALWNAEHIILSGLLQGQEKEAMLLLPSERVIEERICEGEWVALYLR